MRTLLFQTLVGIPEYGTLLRGDQSNPLRIRVYQKGSLGTDDFPEQPPFPFLIIAENPSVVHQEVRDLRAQRYPETRSFLIYAYDEHGLGYLQIEHLLNLARDNVLKLQGVRSPSGAQCTDVRWGGFSVDSEDPDYGAGMKFGTVQFVATQPA